MGKPPQTVQPSSTPSIHSLHALDDDDDVGPLLTDDENDNVQERRNDNPPAYDAVFSDHPDVPGPANANSSRNNNNIPDSRSTAIDNPHIPTCRLNEVDYQVPGSRKAQGVRRGIRNTRVVTLDPILSHSARELFFLIAQQARLPPRPQLVVTGSHTDSRKNKKNANKSDRVIDFDFHLDLAESLLTGWEDEQRTVSPQRQPDTQTWHHVRVAQDCDGIKTFRGSRIKTLTWVGPKQINTRFSAGNDTFQNDDPESRLLYRENGDDGSGEQDQVIHGDQKALLEWCTRFCNDPSPVKSFTLIREVHNFRNGALIDRLTSHIRETNYRGEITMRVEMINGSLVIYSPHWINKLRNNKFVFWICIILQLWIITWPIIKFLEKRYEVVNSSWYASHTIEDGNRLIRTRKYARGCDEYALAEFWAPAVKKAAWGRRQNGEVVFVDDAQRAAGLTTAEIIRTPIHLDSDAEIERRQRVDRGDGTFSDSVVGFVRGISEARRGWSFTGGWGENS